jgi:hypothetical protein
LKPGMLFSEGNLEWSPVPQWVRFLIRLGLDWPDGAPELRRIALVSMPCDSAAAGLIALGALIRDLGSPSANDVHGHYDALLQYAKQYVDGCRVCADTECRPDLTGCGYIAKATGRLHSPLHPRMTFTISEKTDLKKRQIAWHYPAKRGQGGTQYPSPKYAINWYIDGKPSVQQDIPQGQLPVAPYRGLSENADILPENLCMTWSGLCFAGRVKGEAATHEACASIRFRNGADEYGLTELLTVHGWSQRNSVSRLTFFNPRTDQLDRRGSTPALIVADGDACFLKILGRSEFQRSNVIGVIHRTLDRDPLEAVGNRMLNLRRSRSLRFRSRRRGPCRSRSGLP